MAGPSHYRSIALVYATIAMVIALEGDLTLAVLHALLAYQYWRLSRTDVHRQ